MIDAQRLGAFERELEPWRLQADGDRVLVLGYGEISLVFALAEQPDVAYKRMPLFGSVEEARGYEAAYRRYCELLRQAGLELPEDETLVVEVPGRPVVLYIAQRRLPAQRFCHRLIHQLDEARCQALLERIVERIAGVWAFNARSSPSVELAIDGQISNWVLTADGSMLFVDTSTPIFRESGAERLDPELFLASAPALLRPLLRLLFLEEVMSRYYDRRRVYTDLAANLFKEGRPELLPHAIRIANSRLPPDVPPLDEEEVRKYYRGDKRIWGVFLAFRRMDRWMKTRIHGGRYEFVLPGRIRR